MLFPIIVETTQRTFIIVRQTTTKNVHCQREHHAKILSNTINVGRIITGVKFPYIEP